MRQYKPACRRKVLIRGTQPSSGAFVSACMQSQADMMAAAPHDAGLHMAMASQLDAVC
jgi:hypothetical protein